MKTPKYVVLRDAVIVHFSGKTFTVSKDDPRHEKILALIHSEEYEKIPGVTNNEANEEIRALLRLGARK